MGTRTSRRPASNTERCGTCTCFDPRERDRGRCDYPGEEVLLYKPTRYLGEASEACPLWAKRRGK